MYCKPVIRFRVGDFEHLCCARAEFGEKKNRGNWKDLVFVDVLEPRIRSPSSRPFEGFPYLPTGICKDTQVSARWFRSRKESEEEFLCPRWRGAKEGKKRKSETRSSFYLGSVRVCLERGGGGQGPKRDRKRRFVGSVNVRQRVANSKGQQPHAKGALSSQGQADRHGPRFSAAPKQSQLLAVRRIPTIEYFMFRVVFCD